MPLTENCWLPSLPSATSGLLWRATSSSCGPTTNRCWWPFTDSLNPGHPSNRDSWLSLMSSYPVSPISWQTRFPSHWTLWCATWLQMFLDYHCLAADQLLYLEVAALCANSSLHFSTQHMDGRSILGDISTGTFRPVVPQSFRQHVFETIHNTPTRACRPPNISS